MSDSNRLAARGARPQNLSGAASPHEERSSHEPGRPAHDDTDSSPFSHLAFGLGILALVVPFFIPGVPHETLLLVYFVIGAVLMIGTALWGVVERTFEALHTRRARRRMPL